MKKILLIAMAALMLGNGGYLLYSGLKETADAKTTVSASETKQEATTDTIQYVKTEIPEALQLDVPLILQRPQLPTGCEIVSAAMLLQYAGVDLEASQLALEIPYDEEDPNLGYVGDPFTTDGWTIYPNALEDTLRQYIPSAYDMTGATIEDLKQQLSDGKPVVVWLSWLHGFYLHSVIVTGYDENGIIINDPWTGEAGAWISTEEFLEMWADQEYRALSF